MKVQKRPGNDCIGSMVRSQANCKRGAPVCREAEAAFGGMTGTHGTKKWKKEG